MIHFVSDASPGCAAISSSEKQNAFAYLDLQWGSIDYRQIMAFADEKKSVIEAGKGSLPSDCDKGKVDELIASVMKEAGVS